MKTAFKEFKKRHLCKLERELYLIVIIKTLVPEVGHIPYFVG